MEIRQLKDTIIESIGDSTSAERGLMAQKIIEEKIPIAPFMDILYLEHPVSARFSWLLGDLSDRNPPLAPEILRLCFEIQDKTKVVDFKRVIAKQCLICAPDLPPEIEGELVDKLFEWFSDPAATISIKNYSMNALNKICGKYPELKAEFMLALEGQLDAKTHAFKRRALKILKGIRTDLGSAQYE